MLGWCWVGSRGTIRAASDAPHLLRLHPPGAGAYLCVRSYGTATTAFALRATLDRCPSRCEPHWLGHTIPSSIWKAGRAWRSLLQQEAAGAVPLCGGGS